MGSLRRDFLIVLAVMVAVVGVAFVTRNSMGGKISFFDLRMLNDTHRTVTVQPCWDVDCLDTHGFDAFVVRPGRSASDTGHWPTDTGHEIVVGIRKPGGKPWQFSSCMMTASAPGQQTGVVRVSHARPCFTGTEP